MHAERKAATRASQPQRSSRPAASAARTPSGGQRAGGAVPTPASLLTLQRAAGNRAVAARVAAAGSARAAGPVVVQRRISMPDVERNLWKALEAGLGTMSDFAGKFKGKPQFDQLAGVVTAEGDAPAAVAGKLIALTNGLDTGGVTALAAAIGKVGLDAARTAYARFPDVASLRTLLTAPNVTGADLTKLAALPASAPLADLVTLLSTGHVDSAVLFHTHHVGSIAHGSGGHEPLDQKAPVTLKYEGMRQVRVTQNRLNHFQTGHTFEQFAFTTDNIDRAAQSTFFPVGTTAESIRQQAMDVVFSADTSVLVSAVFTDEFASRPVGQYRVGLMTKGNFISINQFFLQTGRQIPKAALTAIKNVLGK
jgi:hypothetical protein